jgi:hypothetical protein
MQLSKKEPSYIRTTFESEGRARLEDARGDRTGMSEQLAKDQQAEESVSVLLQKSTSNFRLVDDEVKDPYVPFQVFRISRARASLKL